MAGASEYFLQSIQKGRETQPASDEMGTRSAFLGAEVDGVWSWLLSLRMSGAMLTLLHISLWLAQWQLYFALRHILSVYPSWVFCSALALVLNFTYMLRAFNKKKNLFTSKLDLNLRKKLVKCYIWSMALYGAETWTLRAGWRRSVGPIIWEMKKCYLEWMSRGISYTK
jgi:hypothetical protein